MPTVDTAAAVGTAKGKDTPSARLSTSARPIAMRRVAPDRSRLLRVLGVAFGIAAVIGGTIGVGILRAPGMVAEFLPQAWMIVAVWILGGVIVAIDAASTVELAASIRRAGGPFAFARYAFGQKIGLATGLADCLANVGATAFLAVAFAEYLHRLGIAVALPVGVIAMLTTLAVGAVQAMGTRIAGRSQEAASAAKAVAFALLIAALIASPRGAPVQPAALPPVVTLLGLIFVMRAIVSAYSGWNSAAYFVEEVTDPRRSIARATFSGIALVTVIYVLVNIALLSVLTPAEMAGASLVAADAAGRVFGPAGDTVVNVIALVSLLSILSMIVMIVPRILYAIAREAEVPYLSHVSPNGTPMVALAAMVGASALLAISGTFLFLLALSTWLTTSANIVVNLAALAVRQREPEPERPWRMPLYPFPATAALLINTALVGGFCYEEPVTSLQAAILLAAATALAWLSADRVTAAKAVPQ